MANYPRSYARQSAPQMPGVDYADVLGAQGAALAQRLGGAYNNLVSTGMPQSDMGVYATPDSSQAQIPSNLFGGASPIENNYNIGGNTYTYGGSDYTQQEPIPQDPQPPPPPAGYQPPPTRAPAPYVFNPHGGGVGGTGIFGGGGGTPTGLTGIFGQPIYNYQLSPGGGGGQQQQQPYRPYV